MSQKELYFKIAKIQLLRLTSKCCFTVYGIMKTGNKDRDIVLIKNEIQRNQVI